MTCDIRRDLHELGMRLDTWVYVAAKALLPKRSITARNQPEGDTACKGTKALWIACCASALDCS